MQLGCCAGCCTATAPEFVLLEARAGAAMSISLAESHDYVKKILTYWWTNRYVWVQS
jgi:hypothetical protein